MVYEVGPGESVEMVFLVIADAGAVCLQYCRLLAGPIPANPLLDNHNFDKHRHPFDLLGVPGHLLLRAADLQLHLLPRMQGRAPGEGEHPDQTIWDAVFLVERGEAMMFFGLINLVIGESIIVSVMERIKSN